MAAVLDEIQHGPCPNKYLSRDQALHDLFGMVCQGPWFEHISRLPAKCRMAVEPVVGACADLDLRSMVEAADKLKASPPPCLTL